MTPSKIRLLSWTCRLALLCLAVSMAACSSNKKSKIKGAPSRLPVISLPSSNATPSHRLSSYDYPFDSSGNYVTAWAADGERRSGRGSANRSDIASWSDSRSARSAPLSKPRPVSTPAKSRSTSKSRSSSTVASRSKSQRPSTSKKTPTKSQRSYTVRKGDTLSAIARRNGTTVAKLKAANGLKSDRIGIGKNLKIPR